MKVILRTDVENLGNLGDLVEVKPGFGRNYLLPHSYAMLATPSNLKVFELERKKLEARAASLRGAASSLAEKVQSTPITIAMRVGDNDKLYGSVTSVLIAEALQRHGVEVDRRRILLDSPIRALGDYTVRVRLHADVVAELALSVVAEKTHHDEDQEQTANANEESASAEEASAE